MKSYEKGALLSRGPLLFLVCLRITSKTFTHYQLLLTGFTVIVN